MRGVDGLGRIVVTAAELEGQTALGLLAQFLDRPEDRGAGGAELTAGRIAALGVTVTAELALDDPRIVARPFKLGNPEGAGHLAVTAANAAPLSVDYCATDRVFHQGRHRADRDTGRINTVHAVVLDEGVAVDLLVAIKPGAILVGADQTQRLFGERGDLVPDPFRILPFVWNTPARPVEGSTLLGAVGLFAVDHARLTADAEGRVIEDADRPGGQRRALRRGHRGAGRQEQRPAGCGLQKFSSVDGHDSPPSILVLLVGAHAERHRPGPDGHSGHRRRQNGGTLALVLLGLGEEGRRSHIDGSGR